MRVLRGGVLGVLGVVLTLVAMPAGAQGKGGGQGKPPQGGSQNAVLYGDLYVIERDGSGIPITTSFNVSGVTVTCQRPIRSDCTFIPLKGSDPAFNPEEDDPCEVQDAYLEDLQEISFGRQSVARAPASVIDASYAEALRTINLAAASADSSQYPAYSLDPAGRLVVAVPTDDTTDPADTLEQKTIDAPLENLALYRALMKDGCLAPVTIERRPGETVQTSLSLGAQGLLTFYGFGHMICGAETLIPSDLDMFRATSFYAGAADKTDPVSIDELVNVNTYLGINTVTIVEGRGKNADTVTINYFKFEAPASDPFEYDRSVTHAPGGTTVRDLPTQAEVLVVSGTCFEAQVTDLFDGVAPDVDLVSVNVPVCRDGHAHDPCIASDTGEWCGGANWFTQAAEDARKTVWFLHNWAVPEIAY